MKNIITATTESQSVTVNTSITELTMSSRDIAELTNKRHCDIKRDVKNMLEQLNLGVRSFAHTYLDVQNKQQTEYLLPKKYIECLLTGYSIPLRMKVIERLHELESKQSEVKLPNKKELAMMLIESEEEKEKLMLENKNLETKVIEMKSDVEALDRIAKADGSLNLTCSAKNLQQQPKWLISFLSANKWIYKKAGGKSWIGYQDKIQQGYIEHKVTVIQKSDGTDKTCVQVLITPKGLIKLAQMINNQKLH